MYLEYVNEMQWAKRAKAWSKKNYRRNICNLTTKSRLGCTIWDVLALWLWFFCLFFFGDNKFEFKSVLFIPTFCYCCLVCICITFDLVCIIILFAIPKWWWHDRGVLYTTQYTCNACYSHFIDVLFLNQYLRVRTHAYNIRHSQLKSEDLLEEIERRTKKTKFDKTLVRLLE